MLTPFSQLAGRRYLYSTDACSRKLDDEVFAEASKACGVPPWRRAPMWLGVRLLAALATLPRRR
ncbi:DUF1353 domain-containing protein [Massilia varians]|uniref:DUF1353 domain-containing protein n=1 Tax=Massilia varians TaxID=457921 RepID=UPI00351D8660